MKEHWWNSIFKKALTLFSGEDTTICIKKALYTSWATSENVTWHLKSQILEKVPEQCQIILFTTQHIN